MLEAYRAQAAERAALGIPPLPLTQQQTSDLVGLLKTRRRARKRSLSNCSPTVYRRAWMTPPR